MSKIDYSAQRLLLLDILPDGLSSKGSVEIILRNERQTSVFAQETLTRNQEKRGCAETPVREIGMKSNEDPSIVGRKVLYLDVRRVRGD